jgi:hypothetical protein
MKRMIYASSAAVDVTPHLLTEIAASSRRNNVRDGITGMLLYGDRSFFQVLEGEDAAVHSMKERIWADARHEGISILRETQIETPSFPDWTMGCYRVDDLEGGLAMWPIVSAESIMEHLPTSVSTEVMVLARTFLTNIAPRGLG